MSCSLVVVTSTPLWVLCTEPWLAGISDPPAEDGEDMAANRLFSSDFSVCQSAWFRLQPVHKPKKWILKCKIGQLFRSLGTRSEWTAKKPSLGL